MIHEGSKADPVTGRVKVAKDAKKFQKKALTGSPKPTMKSDPKTTRSPSSGCGKFSSPVHGPQPDPPQEASAPGGEAGDAAARHGDAAGTLPSHAAPVVFPTTLPIPPPPRSAVPSSSPASPRLAGEVPGSDSRKGTSFLPSGGRLNPRPVPPYFRPRRPDPPPPAPPVWTMLAVIRCLDRKNVADKQVRWTDIGEKKQELVPNIEKDHAKQVRMTENSSRIQELVPNVKKDRSSHRRSIAELWRRTEISKRVRNLQELVPNMEKVIKQTVGTPKPYTDMALPGINPLVDVIDWNSVSAVREWKFFNLPMLYVFLARFAKAASSSSDHKNDKEMENTVLFFAELALLQYGLVQSKPSTVAAAAVYAARLTLKMTPLWIDTLRHHTGFTEAQLM
ncbi:hypothetical protein D1007_31765 [Hordeum vulgare]|nr:hypothetical protein D1007_31765 [Hordeum vulgare]